MKWVKHDTDANQDAKLKNVIIDYGMEGYGLYWYCIELIAGRIDKDNITFELEHDARIIAHTIGSTQQKDEEMMRNFVKVGLFENSQGVITCLRLARRLDKSMTSNPEMRAIIDNFKNSSHDSIMTKSGKVMQDQIRSDKNKDLLPKVGNAPFSQAVDLYNSILTTLPRVEERTDARQKTFRARWRESEARQSLEWWEGYFNYINSSDFLTGRGDGKFMASWDWIMKPSNLAKIVEGNYHNDK